MNGSISNAGATTTGQPEKPAVANREQYSPTKVLSFELTDESGIRTALRSRSPQVNKNFEYTQNLNEIKESQSCESLLFNSMHQAMEREKLKLK